MTKAYLVVDVFGLPGWRTKVLKVFWASVSEQKDIFREFVVKRRVM